MDCTTDGTGLFLYGTNQVINNNGLLFDAFKKCWKVGQAYMSDFIIINTSCTDASIFVSHKAFLFIFLITREIKPPCKKWYIHNVIYPLHALRNINESLWNVNGSPRSPPTSNLNRWLCVQPTASPVDQQVALIKTRQPHM